MCNQRAQACSLASDSPVTALSGREGALGGLRCPSVCYSPRKSHTCVSLSAVTAPRGHSPGRAAPPAAPPPGRAGPASAPCPPAHFPTSAAVRPTCCCGPRAVLPTEGSERVGGCQNSGKRVREQAVRGADPACPGTPSVPGPGQALPQPCPHSPSVSGGSHYDGIGVLPMNRQQSRDSRSPHLTK